MAALAVHASGSHFILACTSRIASCRAAWWAIVPSRSRTSRHAFRRGFGFMPRHNAQAGRRRRATGSWHAPARAAWAARPLTRGWRGWARALWSSNSLRFAPWTSTDFVQRGRRAQQCMPVTAMAGFLDAGSRQVAIRRGGARLSAGAVVTVRCASTVRSGRRLSGVDGALALWTSCGSTNAHRACAGRDAEPLRDVRLHVNVADERVSQGRKQRGEAREKWQRIQQQVGARGAARVLRQVRDVSMLAPAHAIRAQGVAYCITAAVL